MISRKQTKKTKKNSPTLTPIIAAFAIMVTLSSSLHAMHWDATQKTLQTAVSLGQFERVKEVMQRLSEQEAKQYLPQILYSAVHHKERDMAQFALEAGADPNMIVGDDGSEFTILMHAALHSCPSIVGLLITHKADVLAHDANGYSALNYCQGNHDADYARNSAIILEEKMRELGCNTQKPLNVTLYQAVTKNKNRDISDFIEQLFQLGADPNTRDNNGNTMLDLSLQQLSLPNRKNLNSPIKEKIRALYLYGADTSTRKISDYFTLEEIAKLEKEREIKQINLADERFLKARYAQTPELAELSFEDQRTRATQEEFYEHCPLPNALAQLTHEYLKGPNPRKRKCTDNSTGNDALSTKSRKLEEKEDGE